MAYTNATAEAYSLKIIQLVCKLSANKLYSSKEQHKGQAKWEKSG